MAGVWLDSWGLVRLAQCGGGDRMVAWKGGRYSRDRGETDRRKGPSTIHTSVWVLAEHKVRKFTPGFTFWSSDGGEK